MSRDTYTIEPDHQYGDFAVYQHGVYPRSSVLAGQPRRRLVESFPTVEAAKAAHPTAEVCEHSTAIPAPMLPSTPPDWFDPDAAGEHWDEDY